jgi:hypothetical protein
VAITIGWNLLCVIIGWIAYPQLRERIEAGEYAFLLLLLFPLIGLGLLISAIRSIWQTRQLGDLRLELRTVPASLGQYLGGVLHSDRSLDLRHGVRLTLTCYRETVTDQIRGPRLGEAERSHRRRRGAPRVTRYATEPMWQGTQVLDEQLLDAGSSRTALPVYFRLPRNAPGTESHSRGRGVYWQLDVNFEKAARAGLHSGVQFEVPVFYTAATEEPIAGPAGPDPAAGFRSDAPTWNSPAMEGVSVSASPRGGTVFNFGPPQGVRGAGCTISLLVLIAISASTAWTLSRSHSAGVLIAVAIALLLLIFLCYIHFGVHRLTIAPGEAQFEHTLFGMGRRHRFDPALIQELRPQRGRGDTQQIQWDLPLRVMQPRAGGGVDNKQYMLVHGLAGETVQAIAAQIQEAVQQATRRT